MHSIQTKTTLLNVVAITVAMSVATIISVVSIANLGHESSEKTLSLQCETSKNNLNYYFKSVEQSVNTVSSVIQKDLADVGDFVSAPNDSFLAQLDDAYRIFNESAVNTNGVLTYYYRIDPSISNLYKDQGADKAMKALGFYYEKRNGQTFEWFEPSDLEDESLDLYWFLQPKETKQPLWLPPYITDNLGEYVISYNVPVIYNNTFVGVVGIEIGYETLGEQIKSIKVQKSGYAYIVDNDHGKIIYHPSIDLIKRPEDRELVTPPEVTKAIHSNKHHFTYTYEGVQKHAYWLELGNGMNIVVCVPTSEVRNLSINLVLEIVVAAIFILAAFITITIFFSRHITKPLRELTKAAEEINDGNYSVKLDYRGDDEMAVLTTTVNKLINHLDGYIADLNSLAYSDSLTAVRNKSAYEIYEREIQARIDNKDDNPVFGIAMFDCDDLKVINDTYGHDKGDVYLKNSCHLICRVFQHSPVFRVGGDEFVLVLQNQDLENSEKLKKYFIEKSAEISAFAKEPWEKICVAVGIAKYDPSIDKTVEDVFNRADHLMYKNKHQRKSK